MKRWVSLASVEEVHDRLEHWLSRPRRKSIPVPAACDSVGALTLLEAVTGSECLPDRACAGRDGYALAAVATAGADIYNPLPFRLADVVAEAGEAVPVDVGSLLPSGCDAVIAPEATVATIDGIEVLQPVAPGEGTLQPGALAASGSEWLPAGMPLHRAACGLLQAGGIARVAVATPPRVGLVACGRGAVGPASDLSGDLLEMLVRRDGATVARHRVVDADSLVACLDSAAPDLWLLYGACGNGPSDFVPETLARHGELIVHGVAMGPVPGGGLGRIGKTVTVLLPGATWSCVVGYRLLVRATLRRLAGRRALEALPAWHGALGSKLVSTLGLVELVPVAWRYNQWWPLPVAGPGDLVTLARADGLVRLEVEQEGYPVGALVIVEALWSE